MTVYEGSRYSDSAIVVEEGLKRILFRRVKYDKDEDDLILRFKSGDRLDILAKELYGDSQLQWVILDANPEIFSPEDIEPGDLLIIPHPDRVDV